MELKKGMYVRFKGNNGTQYIGKIVNINEFRELFFKYAVQVNWCDDYVFIGDHKIVSKPSFNLIDLIEVGDYVNGQQVKQISKGDGYYYLFNDCYDGITLHIIAGKDVDGYTKPIESIVTKEQFETMKNVVERDK